MAADVAPHFLNPTVTSASPDSDAPGSEANADARAMEKLAGGEVDALGELYDRHREAVRRFAIRMTGNAADADDLVHATFLAAMKSAGAFDRTRSLRPWLLGIAARLLRRERSLLARGTRLLTNVWAVNAPRSGDPEQAVGARENVERALGRLSHAKREVLVLAEVEGLSGEEIARALEIPLGTVWTRLHHARRELGAALDRGELT